MRRLISVLLLISLMLCTVSVLAEGNDDADLSFVNKLPIDFSGGMPALKRNVVNGEDEWSYTDPSISVKITAHRWKNRCDWWKADIRISDASQLRTVSAGGFDSSMVTAGTKLAKKVHALLAIDGDYYWYQPNGLVIRQGTLYANNLDGKRDALVIDEDGDFHIIRKAKASDVQETINGKRIINGFGFGPVLVEDGKHLIIEGTNDMVPTKPRQRMALCQVGPLHYVTICCGPPARGSTGMSLQEFGDLVFAQGVQTAYNLDGGDSTMLIFNGKKINDVRSQSTREVSDIVYFASSYIDLGVD